MRQNQKTWLLVGLAFFLLLVSYKFSLFHETSQLEYLASPTISPFQRIFTYIFMIIGIVPTILLMLYTSTFCHTQNINGAIQTICFNNQFILSDSGGFFAYIVASLVTIIIGGYLFSKLSAKSTDN